MSREDRPVEMRVPLTASNAVGSTDLQVGRSSYEPSGLFLAAMGLFSLIWQSVSQRFRLMLPYYREFRCSERRAPERGHRFANLAALQHLRGRPRLRDRPRSERHP